MEGGGGGRDKSGHSAPATGSVARIESPRRAWAVVGSIAGRPFFRGWQTLFASLFFVRCARLQLACLPSLKLRQMPAAYIALNAGRVAAVAANSPPSHSPKPCVASVQPAAIVGIRKSAGPRNPAPNMNRSRSGLPPADTRAACGCERRGKIARIGPPSGRVRASAGSALHRRHRKRWTIALLPVPAAAVFFRRSA